MKTLILILLVIAWSAANAQVNEPNDSLPLIILSEITVQASGETDTLQNFFRANRSATTEDILSRVEGVSLVRRGSYGQEPMIHGMSAGQLNVTIDGMKMFGACTDKMDPISIYVEPQNLQGITVMKGSLGSKTGSTVGGAIDMQLIQPRFSHKRFSGQAGTGFQSISKGLNYYANGNISSTTSAYNFSTSYRNADPYTAGNGTTVPYSQYEKFNFSGGSKWSIGSDSLYANVLIDNGWDIGFTALPMDVGLAKARLYALTYQRVRCHGPVETFRVKAYFNSVFHRMDDTQRENVVMHMDMPGESKTSGIFVEGRFKRAGKHELSFRTDFYYNSAMAEMTMYPNNETPMYMQTWPASGRGVSGIYIEDKYPLSASTRIKMDARVDMNTTRIKDGVGKDQLQVFYPEISSSSTAVTKAFNVSLQQMIGNSLLAEFHSGYGERIPTLSETYGFYLFNRSDGFDYVGNTNLKSEKSISSDFTLMFFNDNIQISGTGFFRYLPDYIFADVDAGIRPMTAGANGVKIYHNINSATYYGADVSLLTNLNNYFRIVNVMKYTRAEDQTGTPLPMIPPLTNITALQFAYKQWSIQSEFEGALSQTRINTSFGEDPTPGYMVINLRAQCAVIKQRLIIAGGIENLSDLTYHAHLDWGNVYRPGRNFYSTVTFSF